MREFLVYVYCMCVGFAWIKEASTVRLPDITIETSKTLSPKKIMLTWKSSFTPKRGQHEYIVRYKSKGGTYQRTFIKGTEILLKGLVPNMDYIVYVRAVNSKSRGEWSEPVHVRTKARHTDHNNDIASDITVTEVNERSAALSWNISSATEDIKNFVEFQVILKSKDGQQKSNTDTFGIELLNLLPDTSYAANVYVVQGTGKKLRIGRTKFQTLELQRAAPRKLKVKAVTHRSIAVKWKYIKTAGSNDSVTGYVIQYKQRGSTNTQSYTQRISTNTQPCNILLDNTRKSYRIQGLLADAKYSVRVSGQFRNITGPFTEWLRVKTAEYTSAKPDITVFHTSPTSVLFMWSPLSEAHSISRVSVFIVTTDLRIGRSTRECPLEVDSFYNVMNDLLPRTKYATTVSFYGHAHCTYHKTLEFITVDGKCFEDCRFKASNETIHEFESYLRIIPLHEDKYLLTWQPYERFNNDKDVTYVIRVLGKPFLHPLSTHLIPNNQRYIVLDNLKKATTYTINLQVFNSSSGGQPLSSQFLLVMPIEDIVPDIMEADQDVTETNGVWQATSMDILIDNAVRDNDGKLFDDAMESFGVQGIEGTNLTLVSKLVVEENWYTENISLAEQEGPRVNMMNDVITREDIPLGITCFAQGDPYPSISLLNISSNETLRGEDSRLNRTVSLHVSDASYVGSSSVIGGRAFVGIQGFINITNLTPWDSGQYACVAENIAGSNISVFRIKITPKPLGPLKDLYAQPLTPFEIKVEWEPPERAEPEVPGHVIGYHVTVMDEYDVILREQNISETILNLDQLDPSTMYHIHVAAFDQYAEGEGTVIPVETPAIPELDPPQNITMRTLNSTTIQVSWQPPQTVLERRIHLRGFMFGHRVVGSNVVEEMQLGRIFTNVSIIGLVPDSKYEASVIAMSEDAQFSHTPWVQGNTSRESYMDESVPPPPPNNVFLKLQSGNIIVSWFPPFPEENILVRGYTIDVYHNYTKLQALEVGHKESSVIIYDVEMGVLYRISVQARNRAGISIQHWEEVKIPIEYVSQTPVVNFRGIAMSSTKLQLIWDPPVSGTFSRFVLSYTLAGVIKPELPGGGNLPASVRNYIVRSLQPYTGYVFNITPYLKNFRGATANTTLTTLTDKPTAPPTNISLTVINSTTIVIRCFPPEYGKNGPIVQYRVAYRDKRNLRNNILTEADDTQENLNFYINGLEHATVYEIRVRALTVNGSGPWSPWLQEKTEKREPVLSKVARNLTVAATDTSITLTWHPPEQHISELTGYVLGLGKFIPEVYRTSVPRDNTSFTFTELEPDSVFIVSVRSFNDYGESAAVFLLVNTLPRSAA